MDGVDDVVGSAAIVKGFLSNPLTISHTPMNSNVPRERVLVGRTIEIYRWLDLPHWERAAGRLEALGREAAVQLGRAYRDGGR